MTNRHHPVFLFCFNNFVSIAYINATLYEKDLKVAVFTHVQNLHLMEF